MSLADWSWRAAAQFKTGSRAATFLQPALTRHHRTTTAPRHAAQPHYHTTITRAWPTTTTTTTTSTTTTSSVTTAGWLRAGHLQEQLRACGEGGSPSVPVSASVRTFSVT
ncbi:hypothetical protein E2C01_022633 [Portunus trituberculatus]|uniref:Uncharacterized protein n=1 Tax=Portunus trituberculatus TaxID=210409 RepID=A0A5B7E8F4_PORTR|nr:hypothetical protein [Portunus trituberculatus]